jgi:malate dehydrogenase (oxaloacetate-decarboxylating)(NADP+)
MAARMAEHPLIMALANPAPEIMPEEAKKVRPDAIICTGRSDYPNQVNNVLCFPYIFRGALDVGATSINEEMKIACVKALADLAQAEPSEVVAKALGGEAPAFGPDYLIPSPFDPRLILEVAPAVARAAMDSGVAMRPLEDFTAYCDGLTRFVFRSGIVMKPMFQRARQNPRRLIYADGEDERVLRAVQVVADESLAQPILVGRPAVVERHIKRLALRLRPAEDFELIDPQDNPRYQDYWQAYHRIMERKGVIPDTAQIVVRTDTTVIAALAVSRGEADAMLCGLEGSYQKHLGHVIDIFGLAEGVRDCSAINILILSSGTYFLADTYVTPDPSAEEIAEKALMAAAHVRRFGIEPKVALLSHANFGSADTPSARKMRAALALLHEQAPDFEVDGEMRGDVALVEELRQRIFPNSRLKGPANLLILPNLDAANIAYNLIKAMANGLSVGPILIGPTKPAHILTPSVTARDIVNMSTVAVVDAQDHADSLKP